MDILREGVRAELGERVRTDAGNGVELGEVVEALVVLGPGHLVVADAIEEDVLRDQLRHPGLRLERGLARLVAHADDRASREAAVDDTATVGLAIDQEVVIEAVLAVDLFGDAAGQAGDDQQRHPFGEGVLGRWHGHRDTPRRG